MLHKKYFTIVIALLSLLLIYNCSDSGNDPDVDTGTLTVKLTDAPFPIELAERADVTIDSIFIKNQGDEEGEEMINISAVEQTFNLLDLRNGITETLAELEIPEGTYNQIRLHVVSAEIELTDGQVFNLNIPSGTQTGLKINIHPFLMISSGTAGEILLDFDVEKSFVMRGNPNSGNGITGFNFKPVIRAVNTSDAGRFFGLISDQDANPLENARVWVEADSVVSSTYSDESGNYSLIGIPSGTYALYSTKEGYDTSSVSSLVLEAGDQLHQNFTLNEN